MSADKIAALRVEIDRLDKNIAEAIRRRTLIAKHIGNLRVNNGGTRIDLTREQAVIENYVTVLPDLGAEVALLLFRMARGL